MVFGAVPYLESGLLGGLMCLKEWFETGEDLSCTVLLQHCNYHVRLISPGRRSVTTPADNGDVRFVPQVWGRLLWARDALVDGGESVSDA